jgi:AcrR family transcriptional regulator
MLVAGTWTDTNVPIWSLPERGERGPKARHSRAEIAAAAIRIADAEGIAAVTMRRVAAELGTGTMSLYNYVPAKEHLVQLMADQTADEYVYPPSPPPGSRAAIADLARQGRDIARRHPWLPAVMHRPPPMGPSTLRYIDYFLGLLADTGLDAAAKMETIAIINGFALMYGAMQAALDDERARTGITEQEQQAAPVKVLIDAADSGSYPNLAAALTAPSSQARTADQNFDSCLIRLIDGALGGYTKDFFPAERTRGLAFRGDAADGGHESGAG